MRFFALALILLAAPALADNTADEADVAFSLGNRAFAKRDYDGALAAYFLSYRLVPNHNVLFNIARCFEAQGKLDEAYRYWNDLSLTGLNESDAREVNVSLKRLAPKVALVTVTSSPPGAEVFVDRKDLGSRGKTPLTLAVPPGAHTMLLELDGYRSAQAQLSTSRGHEAKKDVPLIRVVGRVELTGSPEGATIRETVDGAPVGKLPLSLELPPGRHVFFVSADNFVSQQVLVDIKGDLTSQAKVTLVERAKATGTLVVTSNRDQSLVRVNGRDSGFTPTVLTLPIGEYDVEVTTDDVTPLQQHVVITEGQETRVSAELHYAPPKITAASKSQLTVDEAPASVTVITRDELRAFGYQTLPDALQGVRGLFFTDDRIYTYIGVRGFQPPGDLNTRILILWDGHPINDVWAGQGYSSRDLEPDLSAIERIEVVRGPASLLFGTGAFFGVINVVPRALVGGDRHVEAFVGGGGQNSVKARAFGSLGSEGKSLGVTGGMYFGQGAAVTDLGNGNVVQGLDGERSLSVSTRGEFAGFTLVAKLTQRKKQIPTQPLGSDFGLPGTEYTDARGFAELRYEKVWERVTLNARASYDASRYRGWYAQSNGAGGSGPRLTDTGGADWYAGEARLGIKLFDGNLLSASVETQGQFVRQRPVGTGRDDTHSRFLLSGTLMDEWRLWGSRLFLQVGLRVDKYFDLKDVAFSPRGALVARFYETGLTKLVVGRAFRAPNVYETTFGDNLATQRPADVPPRPELITTFELEHSHDFTPELRATIAGYVNLIDQLVALEEESQPIPLCGGGTVQCVVFTNTSGRMYAVGGEAQLRWRPARFTMLDATYSFVWLGGADITGGAYPAHLASIRGIVPIKDGLLRLSAQGVFQSARRAQDGSMTGEAFLLNAGFSGEYAFIRYFAGVQNILDQRPVVPVLSEINFSKVPQYGRTFYVELAASF